MFLEYSKSKGQLQALSTLPQLIGPRNSHKALLKVLEKFLLLCRVP